MKRISGFLLLVTVAVTGTLEQPAWAQGFNLKKNALPDGSQIERSRLRVQIVDPSPIVTDTRKQEDSTTYQINIPPLKQGKNTVVQIGDGGAGSNGGRTSVPIQSNNLPSSTFKSNIPAGGPNPGRALPPGSSSSSGLGLVAGKKLPSIGGQKPMATQAGVTPPPSTETKMYPTNSPPVSSTVNRHSKETVTGVIHRGDLVHP